MGLPKGFSLASSSLGISGDDQVHVVPATKKIILAVKKTYTHEIYKIYADDLVLLTEIPIMIKYDGKHPKR